MDLFPPTRIPVLADAEGGVSYRPGFADHENADVWFESLRDGAAWTAQRRKMYDRLVDVPRLTAAYRTGQLPESLPLGEMLARVRAEVPAPYNAIGLNLYCDGRDSVAMHNDTLHTIVPGHPILLVSLGGPRRMLIRSRTGARDTVALELGHGSLLVMSHASQLTHEHGIPKTTRAVGPRMSVVFRVRPSNWKPD